MKKLSLWFFVVCTVYTFNITGAFAEPYSFAHKYIDDYSFYKWEPGRDSALTFHETSPPPGAPGGATWSILPSGFGVPYGDEALHPSGIVSQDFLSLVSPSGGSFPDGNISSHFPFGQITTAQAGFWPGLHEGDPVPYELWTIDKALDIWAAVSGFENLGPVKDGALVPDDVGARLPSPVPDWNGGNAQNANGGNLGDIRVAAYDMIDSYLGHSIPPSTQTDSSQPFQGLWENWGGDMHIVIERPSPRQLTWVDDENDVSGDYEYDFFTVILHEVGHALGLGHPEPPDDSNCVMVPYTDRGGAQRDLQPGDIQGIQALYGGVVNRPILYVSTNGSDQNSGVSWNDAVQTIARAIQLANDGSEIWVAQGNYWGEFEVDRAVSMYGGFNGTETHKDQRDWKNNLTKIKGWHQALSVLVLTADAVVDGFTISDGLLYGGIHCFAASPTIKNCIIRGNLNEYLGLGGGGMYIEANSSPTIIDSIIAFNESTDDGGGIFINSTSSFPTVITNCIISDNGCPTGGYGSAIHGGPVIITNCTIVNNHVEYLDGGAVIAGSDTTITNSIIWGNTFQGNVVGTQIMYEATSPPTVTYSNIDQAGFTGSGNIRQDPLFVPGSYYLQASSLSIDSGTSNGAPAYDIAGTSRPKGSGYDMGAYEYMPDNDGLSDTDEQGLNGNDINYDGNGDGIPDYLQGNAASLPTHDGQEYVTLETSESFSNVDAIEPPPGAPPGADLPLGCFDFTIDDLQPGSAITVTLHLPPGTPLDNYYKYGPTPNNPNDHWYEFTFDGETGAVINESTITLHLVDGKRGDHDLNTPGRIREPGGPGVLDNDLDDDGITNANDNCPETPNQLQEDTYPPQGNGIGDACDCECDFDCSGGVDSTDVTAFLVDFGRNEFSDPCTSDSPCNGDCECDTDVDSDDVENFLEDFGRFQSNNPCPPCVAGDWCVYP